jgi:hypothetical protein
VDSQAMVRSTSATRVWERVLVVVVVLLVLVVRPQLAPVPVPVPADSICEAWASAHSIAAGAHPST